MPITVMSNSEFIDNLRKLRNPRSATVDTGPGVAYQDPKN